jgi:hypothetical protein
MVTPCPLCHLSLDAWQGKASREADMEFDLPIFHLAQLVGAAAGLSYDELQFKRHVRQRPTRSRTRSTRGSDPGGCPACTRRGRVSPSYAALFRSPYRAMMVAALGATFLGSLDALMVVTALPSAAQDIGGVDLISLAVGATMVTIVMTLPLAGR